MLDRVAAFEQGRSELGALVGDLRGLFVEADPHDQRIRDDFEVVWSRLDHESELRTESWAPSEARSDERIDLLLKDFEKCVHMVLAGTSTTEHG